MRLRRAVDGVAIGIQAVAGETVVGGPVSVGIGGGGVKTLHCVLGAVVPRWPDAAIAVGCIYDLAGIVVQGQALGAGAILHRAGVNQIGGDVAHREIIQPLQEKVRMRRNDTREGDVGCAVGSDDRPVGEVNGLVGGVVKFEPLIGITGRRAHPRHLVDDHVQGIGRGGCHLRRPRRCAQPTHQRHNQQPAQEAGPCQPRHPLHRSPSVAFCVVCILCPVHRLPPPAPVQQVDVLDSTLPSPPAQIGA